MTWPHKDPDHLWNLTILTILRLTAFYHGQILIYLTRDLQFSFGAQFTIHVRYDPLLVANFILLLPTYDLRFMVVRSTWRYGVAI